MNSVYPRAKDSPHEISLSDGFKTWNLDIGGEKKIIQEGPISQVQIRRNISDQRYTDFETGISYLEQKSWLGGKGKKDNIDFPDGFDCGRNIWSIDDGELKSAPQWKYAKAKSASVTTPGLRPGCGPK